MAVLVWAIVVAVAVVGCFCVASGLRGFCMAVMVSVIVFFAAVVVGSWPVTVRQGS